MKRLLLTICVVLAAAAGCVPADPGIGSPIPKGRDCGGAAGRGCGAGTYCSSGAVGACGGAGAGICVPRPEACTMEYRPVCGCDGKTYGNACSAASAGADVAHAGPCR